MAKVRFHQVSEFLEELRKDHDKVDRGLVRVTFRTDYSTPMHTASVIASALISGVVVTVERRCGVYMFKDTPESRAVWDTAEANAEAIRKECAELQLEVRSGVFEAVA